jgi:hypothetical protein
VPETTGIEDLLLAMDPRAKAVAGPKKKSFVELRLKAEQTIFYSTSLVSALFEI